MADGFSTSIPFTAHLAWAAGFIEGEGNFDARPSARVTAAQVQREPIERLQSIFGGKITRRYTGGFSNKPIWIWAANVSRSIQIMMTLYVLMSPKRQAEIRASLGAWRAQKRILKSHDSNRCGHGHLLDEENTFLVGGKYRKCRTCRRNRKRERRARRRALGLPSQ